VGLRRARAPAGRTLRAEGVLAIANLVWVLLLVLGGVIVPRAVISGLGGSLMGWLPSAALADGLRAALVDGALLGSAVGILILWAVGATVLARRTFRWSD
jgi:ABC-2 type transport system permease protein